MSIYKLVQGDCLQVLPTLEDESIDLVLTDPPYYQTSTEKWDNQWDTYEEFLMWLKNIVNICYDKLKPNGAMYVFTAFGKEFNKIVSTIFDTKLDVKNMVIWERASPGRKQSKKRYTLNYAFIWFLVKNEEYVFNLNDIRIPHNYKDKRQNPLGKNPGCVWYIPNIMIGKNSEQVGHPTQKPEALIERMMLASSNVGDVILDPFMGSGTTMKVAQDLGRSCIGIEMDEKYCNIVKKRCFSRTFLDREVKYEFSQF